MSADATAWAYRHSPFKGATLAVHLAIADTVSDMNGNEFWMAQANLAVKARLTDRAVRTGVAELAAAGMIECIDEAAEDPETRRRSGRPTRYRFLFPDVAVVHDSRRPPRKQVPTPSERGSDPPRNEVPTPSERGSDVTQENPNQEPKSAPRARNPHWDALETVFGVPETDGERKNFGKISSDLRRNGCEPAEVERRAREALRRGWTVNAVNTRWSQLAPRRPPPGSTLDDVARRDAEARR